MSGRRRRTRCIGFDPSVRCFKPCGRQGRGLETVILRADELEALRLADLEGLYQEAGAARMGVSRTTLSRTLAEARRKLADALINGKRLLVEPDQPSAERQATQPSGRVAPCGAATSDDSGETNEDDRTHRE
jgi:uncharacterized protein